MPIVFDNITFTSHRRLSLGSCSKDFKSYFSEQLVVGGVHSAIYLLGRYNYYILLVSRVHTHTNIVTYK